MSELPPARLALVTDDFAKMLVLQPGQDVVAASNELMAAIEAVAESHVSENPDLDDKLDRMMEEKLDEFRSELEEAEKDSYINFADELLASDEFAEKVKEVESEELGELEDGFQDMIAAAENRLHAYTAEYVKGFTSDLIEVNSRSFLGRLKWLLLGR